MTTTKSIHGIMRTEGEIAQAISVVSSAKNVPPKFKKYLHKYYHIECSGTDLLQMLLNDTPGEVVIHQNVVYTVIYSDSNMYKATDADTVVLSFRQTKHILNCDNFCVVSIKE